MSTPVDVRAQRVCNVCRARKKGCDKLLPCCSYCQKRGLSCSYEEPETSGTGIAPVPTWPLFIPAPVYGLNNLYSCNGTSTTHFTAAKSVDHESVESWLDTRSFEGAVQGQVRKILQLSELPVHEISQRYFRDFHRWLPIVLPQRFEEDVANFENHGRPPGADLSTLLLAMAMMVFNSPYTGSSQYVSADRLFLTVKTLYAQAQAILTASTRLVQAGMLISAYEYASGKPEAAWISIGTCARMAAVLGMDKNSFNDNTLGDGGSIRLELPKQEEWNVWWGVVILERVIMFELTYRDLWPITAVPSRNSELPSSLDAARDLHAKAFGDDSTVQTDTGSFGRHAQAIYLLDRLLQTIRQPGRDTEKLPQLQQLDGELQAFLAQLLKVGGWVRGLLCGPIGTAVRSLFLLHHVLLDIAKASPLDPVAEQWQQSSQSALDTAAKMIADVAHDHLQNLSCVDTLPICCAYNLRAARRVIEQSRRTADDIDYAESVRSLDGLEKAFQQRWRAS